METYRDIIIYRYYQMYLGLVETYKDIILYRYYQLYLGLVEPTEILS